MAAAFLGHDDALGTYLAGQLGGELGCTPLVEKCAVLVGDDHTGKIQGLAMAGIQFPDDGIVEVQIRGVLLAGDDVVAADDGTIHDFVGMEQRGQEAGDVLAVKEGIAQRAL